MPDWNLFNVFQNRSRKDSDSTYWQGTFTEHMCVQACFRDLHGADLQLCWSETMINRCHGNQLHSGFTYAISGLLTVWDNYCSRLLGEMRCLDNKITPAGGFQNQSTHQKNGRSCCMSCGLTTFLKVKGAVQRQYCILNLSQFPVLSLDTYLWRKLQ